MLNVTTDKKFLKTIFWLINFGLILNIILPLFVDKNLLNNKIVFQSFLIYLVMVFGFLAEYLILKTKIKQNKTVLLFIIPAIIIGLFSFGINIYLWNNHLEDWTILIFWVYGLINIFLLLINSYCIITEIFSLKNRLSKFLIICVQAILLLTFFCLAVLLQPNNFGQLEIKISYILIGLTTFWFNKITERIVSRNSSILKQKKKHKKIWQDIYQVNIGSPTLEQAETKLANLFKEFCYAKSVKIGYKSNNDGDYYWKNNNGETFEPIKKDYYLIEKFIKETGKNLIIAKEIKYIDRKLYKILVGYNFDVLIYAKEDNFSTVYIGLEQNNDFDLDDVEQITKTKEAIMVSMQIADARDNLIESKKQLEYQIENKTEEVKHYNNQLEQIDELKLKFSNLCSEKLKDPISDLSNNLSLLLDKKTGKLSKKQSDLVLNIFLNNSKLHTTIDNIIALSQIESNIYNADKKSTKINTFIKKFIKNYQNISSVKDIDIIYNLAKKDKSIDIDRQKMTLAINNLLDNAINYSQEKTTIIINSDFDKKSWDLTISSQSAPINEKNASTIFDKFSLSDSKDYKLGLYVCKQISTLHDGHIELIESNNNKTSFKISIPIEQ